MGQALPPSCWKNGIHFDRRDDVVKTKYHRRRSAASSGSPRTARDLQDGSAGTGGAVENVLEERDPNYDAMLNKMVRRIKSKPGGKLEMDSGSYEERPTPPGTQNVAQLRHIILLHHGKAEDHNGRMELDQIAEKFRVDVAEVRRILQFCITASGGGSGNQKNNRCIQPSLH